MKILVLNLGEFDNLNAGSVHIDIIKRLAQENEVYLVCKRERRRKESTELSKENNINILRVKIGNIKKTNLIEKGISTILVEYQFKYAISKYFNNIKFDLVLYSTPPITFAKVIEYVKRRDNAKSYLMLKDIFPQNAVDLGMMKKEGIKGLIYKYFRKKEIQLYKLSDKIGCMSPANCLYLIEHNKYLDEDKIEICPNSIFIKDMSVSKDEKIKIRQKYNLSEDKIIFIYGGNLGKPQGINHLIECLKEKKSDKDLFFLIVGTGTEYKKIEAFLEKENLENVRLMNGMPKEEYDRLVGACDIGLLFLDYRFTIPNFPARLLSYMQAKLPVLACTDKNTDVGVIVEEAGFGWWCESNDVKAFANIVDDVKNADLKKMKKLEWEYLLNNFNVDVSYNTIMRFYNEKI